MTGSNWREMFEQGRSGNGRGAERNMGGAVPPAQQGGFAPTHAPAPSRDTMSRLHGEEQVPSHQAHSHSPRPRAPYKERSCTSRRRGSELA